MLDAYPALEGREVLTLLVVPTRTPSRRVLTHKTLCHTFDHRNAQIFSQQRAGSGKPIGERLLTNPDAHLPLEDLDWSNASENTNYSEEAVRSQVTALVRKCGSKGSRDRPEMEEVRLKA